MFTAANSPRGGVAPKTIRLRGQGLIEYVLIAAVIGLVVIFAGPQVSGAIRNQFNLVGNTLNSGTSGDGFMSTEEKAYREAMKTVTAKEAKDWTLDEQKAAATDIAKNGTSSVVYAKAKAAMDAGTEWSVKLTNGETMDYRIIGINHDDLADGNGKAGLTFLDVAVIANIKACMNVENTNVGGWEVSELRSKMNSGEIWNLMPADFQSKIVSVIKTTDNVKTNDKLFLLSATEMGSGSGSVGYRYESRVYPMNVLKAKTGKSSVASAKRRMPPQFILNWLRTPANTGDFLAYNDAGDITATPALNRCGIRSAFCF